jgi:hypothetical protein
MTKFYHSQMNTFCSVELLVKHVFMFSRVDTILDLSDNMIIKSSAKQIESSEDGEEVYYTTVCTAKLNPGSCNSCGRSYYKNTDHVSSAAGHVLDIKKTCNDKLSSCYKVATI